VDTLFIYSWITSQAGCNALDSGYYVQLKPTARILADFHEGCAPLEVNFSNFISTHTDIRFREWDFGDGSAPVQTNSDSITHVFDEPGEYFVKMIIENEAGCIDTSNGIWIHAGERISPDYTLDKTEVCLGETVNVEFLNDDERIDGYNFSTDDKRYSDCWLDKSASHTFITEPGIYDAIYTIDYNGCYSQITVDDAIKVNGSKANISYMINCDRELEAMIMDSSLNATNYTWYQDSVEIQGGSQFTLNFDTAGVYQIKLVTSNDMDDCPESIDSIELNITELKAVLNVPDEVCFNQEVLIDASASTGADTKCHEGYLYNLPGRRPREVDKDTVLHVFPPGTHLACLTVQDINGCTDKAEQKVVVYEIFPDFEPDSTFVCDPISRY